MLTVLPYETLGDAVNALFYLMHKGIGDPLVTQLAQDIARNADPIVAVHNWVRKNVHYTPDPGNDEFFTSPVRIAKNFYAGLSLQEDCDGMALAVAGFLGSLEYRTRIVLVGYEIGDISHAYAEVYLPIQNTWLGVDPTSPYPVGFEIPPIERVVVG